MANGSIIFDRVVGKIKPMHAVNNGPVIAKSVMSRGNGEAYAAARIPYARTHDSSYCATYGGEHTVDIQAIFRNFDADVNDPASYDFVVTDHYLRQIQSVGTKVYYRLGTKIEHYVKKFDIFPPKDNRKWAQICEHIIAHYTEGWADGFFWDIQYWEIWNEPDLEGDDDPMEMHRCWCGTARQFYELYRTAALHLKKRFPHLKIGGPAIANLRENGKWFENFLAFMAEGERVPIDFFSWHIYAPNVEKVEERAEIIRNTLDRFGYRETESILNEWNYIKGWREDYAYSVEQINKVKGAAFSAACMSACQNCSVDMLMYYDARPNTVFNGLFDFYTYRPLKGYYPFYYFANLYELENQVQSDSDDRDIRITAAEKDGKCGAMISYFAPEDDAAEKTLSLTLDRGGVFRCYLVDSERTNEPTELKIEKNSPVTLQLEPQSVLYLEFDSKTS